MSNKDTVVAREYHEATKHSIQSVGEHRRTLDVSNSPRPYKVYSSLEPIALPQTTSDADTYGATLFHALTQNAMEEGERVPDMPALAKLCFLSNGVTKMLRVGGTMLAMHAAASTGAYFHIEMYLICGDLAGLPAGVYHYGTQDHALRRLRAGDFRRVVVEATASEPAVVEAPVIAMYTSTFWRNAYRYGPRAYRHAFWDGGTVLANSLTVANALGLPARVVMGFVDTQVNALLDIDGEREAAIALLSLGRTGQRAPESPAVEPLHLPTTTISRYEIEYPLIEGLQRHSSLDNVQEVRHWRAHEQQGHNALESMDQEEANLISLQPIAQVKLPVESAESVIRRRGSARRFSHASITFEQFSTLLDTTVRHVPFDCIGPEMGVLNTVYVIANAVEGLAHGTYIFRQHQQRLEPLQKGTFRSAARFLALNQDLAGDAAINIYFLVDLARVLAHFGNRGYRLAQLEAAILAGRMYLAAYTLSLGASGLTFFDDDAIRFFAPPGEGWAVMFLLAIGQNQPQA